MKRYLLLLLLCCLGIIPATAQTAAQTATPTPPTPPSVTARASVIALSAFLRAAPSESAEPVTSVFEGETLMVAGRSADGFWVWVHRPYQPDARAWIRRNLLTAGYDVTLLPLGDGADFDLLGDVTPTETGFAATFIAEANLRSEPRRDAPVVGLVPITAVLPVVSRTPDGFWIKVNYRGIEGWVSEFLTQSTRSLSDVPLDPVYESDPRYAVTMPIIPREVQIAQVDRLLAWLNEQVIVAENVAYYWNQMFNGHTMECAPPAPIPDLYPITAQDLIELPELNQETRLIADAVAALNSSIAAMGKCGIYTADQLRPPLRAAANARFIFRAVIQRMENLREVLVGE